MDSARIGRMQKHPALSLSLAFFALFALASSPVFAHHGWSGQAEGETTLTGTLETAVSLAGPHATAKIKTADGQVWDLTMAPPSMTSRSGLREGIIPLGATITVQGHRNMAPKRFEMKVEQVQWSSRTFAVYGNRH